MENIIKKIYKFILIGICSIFLIACSSTPAESSKISYNNFNHKNLIKLNHLEREVVRQEIMLNTMSLIGIPYKWGGSNRNGFDCSGMVQYIYRTALGVNLPRVAKEMAKTGKSISRNKLNIGDLVFFNTTGHKYSHVGIYIGDNKFIHAPNKRKKIKIDSLNNSYYSRQFTLAMTLFK